MKKSFHRRELKEPGIAFSSLRGRELFTEAVTAGYGEAYFSLAEQFQTQSHYAYCGITSLSMCLNTMLIDPGRVWQGVWRWFDDSLLDCCEPLEIVQQKGITMDKLACLAKCNGAHSKINHASDTRHLLSRNEYSMSSY